MATFSSKDLSNLVRAPCRFDWYAGRSTELAGAYAEEAARAAQDEGAIFLDIHTLMVNKPDWKPFLSGLFLTTPPLSNRIGTPWDVNVFCIGERKDVESTPFLFCRVTVSLVHAMPASFPCAMAEWY